MTEHQGEADFKHKVANHTWQWTDPSPVQDAEVARLPEGFKELASGHMYSHQMLIDDFCKAVHDGTMPLVNAWQAARFTIPGLIAHEAAMQGGVWLDVPDFGDAPEKLERKEK